MKFGIKRIIFVILCVPLGYMNLLAGILIIFILSFLKGIMKILKYEDEYNEMIDGYREITNELFIEPFKFKSKK